MEYYFIYTFLMYTVGYYFIFTILIECAQAGEGQREKVRKRERERERERESQAGSELSAEPDVGLNPQTVKS